MNYEWFESIPFILCISFFWFLIIPIPIAVYLFLRRLEKQQLSRLIIAKILGIDYYKEEIAILEGTDPKHNYDLEFEITEIAYQKLAREHEELRMQYDRLLFEGILERRIMEEENGFDPNINSFVLEDLIEESEKEKEDKKEEKKTTTKKDRINPVVKKGRIIIEEDDFFNGENDTFF